MASNKTRFCHRHNAWLPRDQFPKVRSKLCDDCVDEDKARIKAKTHKRCKTGHHVVSVDQFARPTNENCKACTSKAYKGKQELIKKRRKEIKDDSLEPCNVCSVFKPPEAFVKVDKVSGVESTVGKCKECREKIKKQRLCESTKKANK